MRKVAVIDSSSLISFDHLGLAEKLCLYFSAVFVPRAVQREVNRKARFRYRLNRLYRQGFFQRCKAADKTSVNLLLIDLDEGESEALIQAQEKQATEQAVLYFIGDERRAREIGENMGLKPVGTVRLSALLHRDELAPEPKALVRRLRHDLGFRMSEKVVEEAIAMASEPID